MKNINLGNQFTIFGFAIATTIIVFVGHALAYQDRPMEFFSGLIDPATMLMMLILFLISLVVGCFIGVIPAFITGLCFKYFFENKLVSANYLKTGFYGFLVSFIWLPMIFLFYFIHSPTFDMLLIFWAIVILPTCIICAMLEKRQLNKLQHAQK